MFNDRPECQRRFILRDGSTLIAKYHTVFGRVDFTIRPVDEKSKERLEKVCEEFSRKLGCNLGTFRKTTRFGVWIEFCLVTYSLRDLLDQALVG